MRAAVLRSGNLVVDDVEDPAPGFGQVLVRTLACGICGSDLHFMRHASRMVELSGQLAGPLAGPSLDLSRDVFMGHEFAAEVIEAGPDTVAPPAGTVVTSMPVLVTFDGIVPLAYNNDFPAGYAERMLLSAPMLLEVPNGLLPQHAALTEPMAVGIHAVARSGIRAGEAALVLGCGPVGLAVVAALRLRDVEPIVAADFSPARRELARTLGAHEAVDPREEPGVEAWRRVDGRRTLVVFEAVGVPGMIDSAFRDAPPGSRVVVVGVCMEEDVIQPFFAIAKELNVQFALAYDPTEFAGALRSIAEGEIDVTPLITGTVGIDGVPAAFEDLAHPDAHAKILVEPG
ncbi:MAG: zinc-binding dehydrogenase [Actinobacteria bacterium]|nr:MAG: zinc-binding dehydrogenase [Actinomycetota bacterium]